MKSPIYISSLLAGSLLASCELDSPTISTLDKETVFTTVEMADAAVMGIHVSFAETNSYRGRFIPYYGANTDCEVISGYGSASDPTTDQKAQLGCYCTSPTNTQMNSSNNAWGKLYEGIERANVAIESMEEYSDLENDEDLRQLYGELLTLRAMIYLDLVKAWGDVPARFEPVTSETVYLAKSSRKEIVTRIMSDLETAEGYLGWPNDNDFTRTTERVSKSFAKALRARCALFMAGVSYYYPAGALEANSENPTEMYQIALQECKDVIESGKNQLGEFKDNFLALCKDDVTAGKESIYEIPFAEGRGRVLYTYGIKHAAKDQWTQQAQGGAMRPAPTLWYDYDKDDVRRGITLAPYRWGDVDKTTNKSNKEISGNTGLAFCFGKLRYEWMDRIVTSTNDDGVNFQVMRLADVYLMAAEAENELNGPAGAGQYMKPILDRAYPAEKATEILSSATVSADAFRLEIMNQRKLEFAGEAVRKLDLIRWGKLSEVLQETKDKMSRLANREGEYANYPNKIYYNENLGADPDDAEGYTIYGLNEGETDESIQATYEESSNWFVIRDEAEAQDDKELKDIQDNNTSINGHINNLFVNDPNSQMFWPIWENFINSSNGMLTNEFGVN